MQAIALRFLADESCDFAVVRALRADGHDIFAVSEVMNRSDDRELIDRAYRERRIVLTEDKDFGRLVYVSHADSSGVILIRFPGNARRSLVQIIRQVVKEQVTVSSMLLSLYSLVMSVLATSPVQPVKRIPETENLITSRFPHCIG